MRPALLCASFAIWAVTLVGCTPAPSGEQAKRHNNHQSQQGVKSVDQPSALEKVKAWAGAGATVSPYESVSVPGLALFSVTPAPPEGVAMPDYTPPRRGVAVQGSAILEGKAAMQAAMDAGASEAEDVARLALLFLHDGGELVTGDGAAAPGYQGRLLVYYWRTSDMGRQLMKSQLDPGALVVTTEPGAARPDPVAEARATLASGSQITWRTAVGQLQALCATEESARTLLVETARTHADAPTRAQAAEAAGACKSPEVIAPLGEILASDPDEQVRASAAAGLGAAGDDRAAEALRAAQAGEESVAVRRAIAFALGKIQRGTP